MAGFFGKWSKTAASNSSADSTVNWAEGQAPSSVNDSARAMMASAASYRDDVSGALVCGGTSTAYTLTTNQAFAALADMDGQELSFVVTPANGDAATLNVNGLGAKALVFSIGNAMPAGSLLDGAVYTAVYVNASNCWKVHSPAVGNPYNVPLAGGMDYWGTTVPNSNFAFPIGQAISRTTYATLFAIMGTTYGVGDGSTTFNLPDKTGRVSAMKEASATRLTAAGSGITGSTMGSANGLTETHALTTPQLAVHSHGTTESPHVHGEQVSAAGGVGGYIIQGNGSGVTSSAGINTAAASTGLTINNAGSGNAHNNVQPTIVCNYIIRVI